MRRAANDAANVHGARKLWLSWIGDIVLTHLAGAPARDVEKLSSIDRSMSVTSGGTAPNPCNSGGSCSLGAASGGIVAVFSMWNLPPSRHQVQIEPSRLWCRPRRRGSRTREPDRARAHFQRHLMIGAEIDGLDVSPGPQIPEVIRWPYLFESRSPARSRSRTAAAMPTRSSPCNPRQVPPEVICSVCGTRSISHLPSTSKVWQSMMKMPGGPSVPSLPPPPSVLT